jgi:hypothetical protein
MKKTLTVLLILFTIISCKRKEQAKDSDIESFCKARFSQWNKKLSYVIMTDIFSPPVCSRIYAYPNIAAYEALLPQHKTYKTYGGRLNGLEQVPQPSDSEAICYPLSAAIAFTSVASKLVFNSDAMIAQEKEFLLQLDSMGIRKELLEGSVNYGRRVGKYITEWAMKDGYKERTAFGGYVVKKDSSRWVPTPPDYIDAVENNWGRLRTMVLDSASQFRPPPPIAYSSNKNSEFYKESMRVYDAVLKPNPGDSATAWYWDDNPNTSVTDGHITYFIQKNSPPGHWIHIVCSIAEKEKYEDIKAAYVLSKTAIALYDAFIACWDAKYYYNYPRPETFINKHIDKDWQPLIQCPGFPEYPSGHSTISASAAAVLTRMIGDNYQFSDSTEVPYGRPVREFTSFYQASDEASISRLYGGIHYLSSLNNGAKFGREVGNYVMDKLE